MSGTVIQIVRRPRRIREHFTPQPIITVRDTSAFGYLRRSTNGTVNKLFAGQVVEVMIDGDRLKDGSHGSLSGWDERESMEFFLETRMIGTFWTRGSNFRQLGRRPLGMRVIVQFVQGFSASKVRGS